MGKGSPAQQKEIQEIITQRDGQKLITTTVDLAELTGRTQYECWRSLTGLEKRGQAIRAGKLGKRDVWTCSKSLVLSRHGPVMTSIRGDNADLMEQVARLYLPPGSIVADVTYGLGAFCRQIDVQQYRLLKSDLAPLLPKAGQGFSDVIAADFRCLPYRDETFDVVVLDPPYMHGGKTIKRSINDCYLNNNGSGKDILELYRAGIAEAHRVLKTKGLVMVKVGDEVESGKVQFAHIAVHGQLEGSGFEVVQYFVLTRKDTPLMRQTYQLHARSNHSFLLRARKRRAKPVLNLPSNTYQAKGRD
jgi:ubiquinone/menaquinone biosynthesis C-methylase UbiE